jgi:hypothetical protein
MDKEMKDSIRVFPVVPYNNQALLLRKTAKKLRNYCANNCATIVRIIVSKQLTKYLEKLNQSENPAA